MKKQFNNIKVIIWDFDGTFYPPNHKLFHIIRESEYQAIMFLNHWPREKAVTEFHKLHKVTIQSATVVISTLCHVSVARAAIESEKRFDRRKYIEHDQGLIEMFDKLKPYRHYILANGVKKYILKMLEVFGIPMETFEDIVTSDTIGVTKPDEKGFRYIIEKTGLPPNAHLMIGDRDLVDLVPAKKLGMRTCLVWSDTQSTIADVTLSTVYKIPDILK